MNSKAEQDSSYTSSLVSILAISAFLSVAGFYWDGWWHVTIGRHTFWTPAHIVEYGHIVLTAFVGLLLFFKTKEKDFLRITIFMGCVILGGVLDIIWHQFFGFERLDSPLSIWSPPHVFGTVCGTLSMVILLKRLLREYDWRDSLSFVRLVLVSASIFGMISLMIFPIQPFGWHKVLGFYGPIITVAVTVMFLMYLAERVPKSGIVTLTTLFLLTFFTFQATTVAPIIHMNPYARPPHWLHFFAIIPSVIWFDYIDIRKMHMGIMGAVTGFAVYFIYWLFWRFIETPDFPYTQMQALLLIATSTIGGYIGGMIYRYIKK